MWKGGFGRVKDFELILVLSVIYYFCLLILRRFFLVFLFFIRLTKKVWKWYYDGVVCRVGMDFSVL